MKNIFYATKSVLIIFFVFNCKEINHYGNKIYEWARKHRQNQIESTTEENIEKWKKEYELTQKEAEELFANIQKFAQLKKMEGEVAWRIGKAFMQLSSFELAKDFFKDSLNQKLEGLSSHNYYEEALPYFDKAIKNYPLNSDLLYDAGICYGNASRNMGWEIERLKIAIFLLEAGAKTYPEEIRFYYPLALLYGKSHSAIKDIEKAIKILEYLIKKEKYYIDAYFAKAHIEAENGLFEESYETYNQLSQIIEEMHNKKILKGSVQENSQYRKVLENMKQLEICKKGEKECKIEIISD